MNELPEPMVPAEVDLRGMPFIPLDIVRLFDSDLYALSTGDEFKAALTLWGKSFLQVPAASLPTDDRILAHLSGAGSSWRKVKEMALRGWVTCSDGRMYHPVVAEKASEAWAARVSQRHRTEAARRAREEIRQKQLLSLSQGLSQTKINSVTSSVTDSVTGSKGQGQGQGQGQGIVNRLSDSGSSEIPKENPLQPAAPPAPKKKPAKAEDTALQAVCKGTWAAYRAAYALRYAVEPIRNAKISAQVKQFCQRVPTAEAPGIAAFFVRHNASYYVGKGHAVGLLLADAEKLRTEWATNQTITQTRSTGWASASSTSMASTPAAMEKFPKLARSRCVP